MPFRSLCCFASFQQPACTIAKISAVIWSLCVPTPAEAKRWMKVSRYLTPRDSKVRSAAFSTMRTSLVTTCCTPAPW
eukprot:scaffold1190_cov65-Phaeocystis_antarctica.AAC.1